ncbi:MAG: RNA-binding protein [Acidimicrobiia bacterium]|nr:MAG: RNA-binding protein [Acidimicrobiia bacterium]
MLILELHNCHSAAIRAQRAGNLARGAHPRQDPHPQSRRRNSPIGVASHEAQQKVPPATAQDCPGRPQIGSTLSTNIFVGNLSFSTTNDTLRSAFESFGEVTSANVITDRDTGRSRGFGFVEMASAEAANTAIEELDGSEIDGRRVNVNEARQRR